MCRNIRPLFNFEPLATRDEVYDAALQYVRKISGVTKPSQANTEAFHRAVNAVAEASTHLLNDLVTTAPPKDREIEAAKARARAATRYRSDSPGTPELNSRAARDASQNPAVEFGSLSAEGL